MLISLKRNALVTYLNAQRFSVGYFLRIRHDARRCDGQDDDGLLLYVIFAVHNILLNLDEISVTRTIAYSY